MTGVAILYWLTAAAVIAGLAFVLVKVLAAPNREPNQ